MAFITEIDVINLMFSAVSESPVASLAEAAYVDYGRADRIFKNTTLNVLSAGFVFNTFSAVQLANLVGPNPVAGITASGVTYPIIRTENIDPTVDAMFVPSRGLVRKTSGTILPAEETVLCRAIVERPWADIPESVKHYISLVSRARYANDAVTSEELAKLADPEIAQAYQIMIRDWQLDPIVYASSNGDWRVNVLNKIFSGGIIVRTGRDGAGQPVTSAEDLDINRLLKLLDDSLRWVLSQGWSFNTLRKAQLAPQDGVTRPAKVVIGGVQVDTMHVFPVDPLMDFYQAGTKIIDANTGASFLPDEPVYVRAIMPMAWGELPEAAQQFVISLAKAKYNDALATSSEDGTLRLDAASQLQLQQLATDFTPPPPYFETAENDWRVAELNQMFKTRSSKEAVEVGKRTVDVKRALEILDDAFDWMLSMGWSFNTIQKAPLAPIDAGVRPAKVVVDGVEIPTISLETLNCPFHVVQVGDRITRRDTGSSAFTDDVECRAVVRRGWDEIPESARRFVLMVAKARYTNDAITTGVQASIMDKDIRSALEVLQRDFTAEQLIHDVTMIPDWRLYSPQRRNYGI